MNYIGPQLRFVEKSEQFDKLIYAKVVETDNDKKGEPTEYEGVIGYCPKYCEITRLFVSEAYRNQGIGTQLFRRAVSKMSHCSEITVRAYKSQGYSSVRFYQNQGMRISDNDPLERYLDADIEDTVHMYLKKRN